MTTCRTGFERKAWENHYANVKRAHELLLALACSTRSSFFIIQVRPSETRQRDDVELSLHNVDKVDFAHEKSMANFEGYKTQLHRAFFFFLITWHTPCMTRGTHNLPMYTTHGRVIVTKENSYFSTLSWIFLYKNGQRKPSSFIQAHFFFFHKLEQYILWQTLRVLYTMVLLYYRARHDIILSF